MTMRIDKLDHDNPAVRERLIGFLAPHEAACLFITGNLLCGFPGSHLYAAERGGRWLGVAGYYDGPRSVAAFALEAEAARELARAVAGRHPEIDYFNAVAATAEPGCEALRPLGYELAGDPRDVLMELVGTPPPQPGEELARPIAPADHEAVARLLRHLGGGPQEPPVTEDELAKVRANPLRHVLVADGRVVSTGCTNGKGLSAFQILGVVTEPEHRGRGCARAVCASLIRAMHRQGASRTVIFTGRENRAAQRCYLGLGFRPTGEFWVAKLKRGAL
jgi:ribosomal protein S18 acetylase RimI-like enzyme